MYTELNGKLAVVTGAGGSLGAAVARRLHQDGVRLALLDRSEEPLQKLNAEIGGIYKMVDLTDNLAVEAAVVSIVESLGGIDILVNVAGAFVFSGPVHAMNPIDLDSMLNVNVKTAFLLSAAVAKRMVTLGKSGRIINVGARAGLTGVANMAAYSASKAAVLNLTEAMAAELRDSNITVNAVLPSTIDTPANRKSMPDADPSKWVTPESIADVIAFLASDSARDISGALLPVYGKS